MATDVKKLIAAINPDVYCDKTPDERGVPLNKKVKDIVEKEGYLAAAKEAKLRTSDYVDVMDIRMSAGAFKKQGLKEPIEQHKVVYDAYSQSLEQIYFWILDYVNEEFKGAEKLVDNFISSTGSAHFAEMGQRATRMQEEAMKMFGMASTVVRGILNIIYDLKEWKLKLAPYDDLKFEDEGTRKAAMYSLKQTWMDNVDAKRGTTSIKQMSMQFDFVTLIDAFMAVEDLKSIDKLDLNERVKRILQQRLSEFLRWIVESEKALKKRYEVEKIYLRSQVNTARLYARWLKPYLKAASELEQRMEANAGIVNMFNTSMFELVILAKGDYDPKRDIAQGELPEVFKKIKTRKLTPLTVIEFIFRSVPERTSQQGGYGFRGKVEVTFTSFALNDDELKVLKEKVEEDDLGDAYKWIAGATDESLGQIKDDLDELLGEKEEKKKEEEENVNPFSALFSFISWGGKEEKMDLSRGIPKDSDEESILRSQAILSARWDCRRLWNSFKNAHGMLGYPPVQY